MKAISYIPKIRERINIPVELTNLEVAWGDIPTILKDIIVRFNLKQDIALDLGVLFGYSTFALSHYFKKVIGVDTFRNDRYNNSIERKSNFKEVCELLKLRTNIELVESMYQDYVKLDPSARYDLIHVDMIHNFKETFEAGKWALQHSDCIIFHDTDGYEEVYAACAYLADKYEWKFYNYNCSWGLGILVKT